MSELSNIAPARVDKTRKSYLFYGPAGTGKTLLATKHFGKRKLFIDADNKLHEMEFLTADELLGIDVWPLRDLLNPGGVTISVVDPKRKDATVGFDSSQPEPKGFQHVVDVTNDLLRLADKGEYPYDVTILDSGTRVVDHLINAILYKHRMGSMTETLWGVFATNWNNFLQGFLRLPADRIVIFHDRHVVKRDKEGHIIEEFTRPSVFGQSGMNIASYFSEVYYFTGRNAQVNKYFIQTGSDSILPARTTKGLDFKQEIDPARIFV